MTPELKEKIAAKNKIVEFYQKGFYSEEEFNAAMTKANEIENEFHNRDIVIDEQNEIGIEEVESVTKLSAQEMQEKIREWDEEEPLDGDDDGSGVDYRSL